MGTYLDYNASAPIDSRVLDYMIDVYRADFGNSDSRTHSFGNNARKVVEDARGKVAALLGRDKTEVFFTSGATESNNIALLGLKEYAEKTGKKHIITTTIEHKAILETAKQLQREGFEVDFVKPDIHGRISVDAVKQLVKENTLLVSIMHVNNETGIIQPVQEIGDFLSTKGVLFHIDATQSFGKLVTEIRDLHYNILSASAHKIGGPQGVGLLVLRKEKYKLPPVKNIMYGGKQEHGLRPGTLPVALIGGFGKACELAQEEHGINEEKCIKIKDIMLELLRQSNVKYHINGDLEYGICNTLNVCFEGVSSEALMLASQDYCGVSNGSACNTTSYEPSFVLQSMGIPLDEIESSIRISWGADTDIDAVKESFAKMLMVAKGLA